MRRGLYVFVCRSCGRKVFPPRALCSDCGGASWKREPAGEGVVEEVTTIRHAVGVRVESSVSLAAVRLDAGPVVVARLDGRADAGARVELLAVDGAPVARAARRNVL